MESVHVFERAGLGKAPFRILGVEVKVGPIRFVENGVEMMSGAPGQPMGSCQFCGQGIAECWRIRSADGKTFIVGCDCVRKTGDAGLKSIVDQHKRKINRQRAKAKAARVEDRIAVILADADTVKALSRHPHPNAHMAAGNWGTLVDYLRWMHEHAGAAGRARALKACEKALAGTGVPA